MSNAIRLLPGVFIGSHAVADGLLTEKQLRQRGYRRLVHGVYADPALPLDHRLRCRGAALLMPAGLAIGGHSAAAWYGAPFAGPRDPVTVIRPPDIEWKGPRGVRVHRSRTAFDVVRDADDVTVTSPLRTAWDTAVLESLGTGVAALDGMVRAGAVDLPSLSSLVSSGTGQWGVAKVRKAVELVDPRAESPPESHLRVALVLAGLLPVPQLDVHEKGVWLGRVDLGFPEAKVAVEYEGPITSRTTRSSGTTSVTPRFGRPAGRSSGSAPPTYETCRVLSLGSPPPSQGAYGHKRPQEARAALTTARASSCTWARCSGPRKDSA